MCKVRLLLSEEFEQSPGIAACLVVLTTIVNLTSDDEAEQVFTVGLALLDDVLDVLKRSVYLRICVFVHLRQF